MDDTERRHQDRRQDEDTASQITEAAALNRAFGSDAAQRFLKLRGIGDRLAQLSHGRRRSHARSLWLRRRRAHPRAGRGVAGAARLRLHPRRR